MPVAPAHGVVPLPVKNDLLKPQTVHSSLSKKMNHCAIYSCNVVDKFSTKWKKQKRVLVVTTSLLLVCGKDGNVSRVIDVCELEEIALQQEGESTLMLFRLVETSQREPDLLVASTIDKRNTHPPTKFMDIVALVAKNNGNQLQVTCHPSGGAIKGMARLAHNPISAQQKLKLITTKPRKQPINPPTLPQPPPQKHIRLNPEPSQPLNRELQLNLDSRPTSDASGLTPTTKPLNSSTQSDAPLSPLSTAPKLPPLSITATSADLLDKDAIDASRQRAQSGFIPKFDELRAGDSSSDYSDQMPIQIPKRKQRSVSFTTPNDDAVNSLVKENTQKPVLRGVASAMPPIKSLPEDDDGGCGWTEHKHPSTQLTYYHNERKGISTWHEPEELKEWKANQKQEQLQQLQQHNSIPPTGVANGTGPLGAGGTTSKRGILLQRQHEQRMASRSQESDSDSDDSLLAPAPRPHRIENSAGQLPRVPSLPSRNSIAGPLRCAKPSLQPCFQEQPISEGDGLSRNSIRHTVSAGVHSTGRFMRDFKPSIHDHDEEDDFDL